MAEEDSGSLVNRLEQLFHDDENDPVEPFGKNEQHLAKVVLFVVALPAILVPSLSQYFRQRLVVTILFLIVCIVVIFLVIQYRFDLIVWLSGKLLVI